MSYELAPGRWNRGNEAFEREMDRPEYTSRAAELSELERTKLARSPAANVEFALEQYERNLVLSRNQRWDGQERWQGRDNANARMVNVLHCHAFIRRLQRAGVDARIEYAPAARMWLNDFSRGGRIGVNARVMEGGVRVAKTITTLQYPWSYEYSLMRFNEYNVPTKEKYRGWRTTLLALIQHEAITEQEADRAFGPALGLASPFYNLQLQIYRTARMGLAV